MLLASVWIPASPAFAATETLSEEPDDIWGVVGLSDAFATNMDAQVLAIEQIGNTIYVGGKFLEVVERRDRPAFDQSFLAAFDATTGEWIDWWTPQFNGLVHALEASPDGSRLFVGGEFTAVDGVPNTEGFVSLDPATGRIQNDFVVTVDTPPGVSNPGVVREIHAGDDWLYIGGSFNYIQGPTRLSRTYVWKVARVDLDTGVPDTTWRPVVAGGGVWGIVEDSARSRVHFVGDYESVNGVTSEKNFSTVSSSGGAVVGGLSVPINTTPNQDNYFDVEIAGGRIWLAGTQHEVKMLDIDTRQELRRWFAGYDYDYGNIGGDFQVLTVSPDGQRVIAAAHAWGAFREIGLNVTTLNQAQSYPVTYTTTSNPLTSLVSFDATTGDYLSEWRPNISGSAGGWALHFAPDGCLWAGGDYNRVADGDVYNNGVVRFCDQAGQGPPVAPSLTQPADDTESNSPSAPGNVQVRVTQAGDGVVEWNESTDDTEVSHYEIYKNGTFLLATRLDEVLDEAYTAGDVYSVRAVDIFGNVSPFGGYVVNSVYSTDFESNDGWVTDPYGSDDASTGEWEIADPSSTSSNGITVQRGDATSGDQTLVTDGTSGFSAGSYDIDDGVTTVRSPQISLPAASTLRVGFDYYLGHTSNSSTADYFRMGVEVGGSVTTLFEDLGASTNRAGVWTPASIDLSAYAGQTIRLVFSAADESGGSLVEAGVDTLSVVAIGELSSPPTVTTPTDQTATVGTPFSVAISASDPDGDTLSFSATGLPSGLGINGGTGVISGTPTTEGTYTVVVTVTDGTSDVTASFDITVSAFVGGSYPAVVESDGAIAYWRLGDTGTTAIDVFGLASATYVGSPTQNAASLVRDGDGAVDFDGVNDLVEVPDTAEINTGGPFEQRSVELWFRADDVNARGVLFEEGSTTRGASIYVDAGRLYAGAWNRSDNGDGTTPWASDVFLSTPVAPGTINHLVWVLDQPTASMRLYLNGAQVASSGGVGRLFGHGGDVGIGAQNNDGRYHDRGDAGGDKYFFNGVIDDVSVYNAALSSVQVQDHYVSGNPGVAGGYADLVLAGGPIAYWRVDEPAGATVAVDLTGGNDGTYVGGPVLGWASLIQGDGTALFLDGTNDFVVIPNASEINTGGPYETKTVELWFSSNNATPRQVLYEQGATSRGINVYVENGTLYAGLWNRADDDATTPWASDVWLTSPVSAGQTYHAVLVYDYPNDLASLYVNGAVADTATGFGRLFSHGGTIGLGAQNDNALYADRGDGAGDRWFFPGVIDEVALYNTALSASTILEHYLLGS